MTELIMWIDAETSGLDPDVHDLLEVASILTDMNGNVLSTRPFHALVKPHSLSQVLSNAEDSAHAMHHQSGLWIDLWNAESVNLNSIEDEFVVWLNDHVESDDVIYFGGNSITLDRRFVNINMPRIYERLSHRSVDVTSIALFMKADPSSRRRRHRALCDVLDSIEEYRILRQSL